MRSIVLHEIAQWKAGIVLETETRKDAEWQEKLDAERNALLEAMENVRKKTKLLRNLNLATSLILLSSCGITSSIKPLNILPSLHQATALCPTSKFYTDEFQDIAADELEKCADCYNLSSLVSDLALLNWQASSCENPELDHNAGNP